MNTDRKKEWDDLKYRILAFAVERASIGLARLIRELPAKTADDVLERLMARGTDVFAEEIAEVIERAMELLKPAFMAYEGDGEKLIRSNSPTADGVPVLTVRAGKRLSV